MSRISWIKQVVKVWLWTLGNCDSIYQYVWNLYK